MRSIEAASLSALVVFAACGGKVMVDQLPAGEQGGAMAQGGGVGSGEIGTKGGAGSQGGSGGSAGRIPADSASPPAKPKDAGAEKPEPLYTGCPADGSLPDNGDGAVDAALSPDRREVARIVQLESIHTSEVDVVVYSDASADRSLAALSAAPYYDPQPKSFPACSPEVTAFLTDLANVGGVSAMPKDWCAKPVYSGTTTTVASGGKTSGDLQCFNLNTIPGPLLLLAEDVDTLIRSP
jgi:hypothetical protein